jgi:UDP-glucose 4-epimerase
MGAAKAGAVAVNIIDPQHFVRDYIHVNDVAEAFAAVITNLKSQEKFLIINVGTGVARSTARLIEELKANGFEPKTNLQNGEMITNVVADTARAEELLNFRAHTEILFNQL